MGTKAIAAALNGEGVPSPGKTKWGRSRVHVILTNEVYTGTLTWGSGEFNKKSGLEPVRAENSHESLVSKKLFKKIQQLMRSRSPKITSPRVVASPYLLSGIIKCGGCKKAMFGVAAKSGKYHYYNCANMDCNELFIACEKCLEELKGCCALACTKGERVRPLSHQEKGKPFRKWYNYFDE